MNNTLLLPEAYNDVIGLGVAKTLYKVGWRQKWGYLIGALIFAAIAVGSFIIIALDVISGKGVIVDAESAIGVGVVFLVLVGLFLFMVWKMFDNWNKSAVEFQNGIAYNSRKGLITCCWDEIDAMRASVTKHYTNGVYTGTTHSYSITKRTGDTLVLDDALGKVEALYDTIRSNAFPILYRRYSEAYNSGQVVQFGPVSISRAGGIQMEKKSYPWDQIASVSIQQGYIRVAKKGGGWFSGASVMASSVPNVEILLSIVDQLVGVQAKK